MAEPLIYNYRGSLVLWGQNIKPYVTGFHKSRISEMKTFLMVVNQNLGVNSSKLIS